MRSSFDLQNAKVSQLGKDRGDESSEGHADFFELGLDGLLGVEVARGRDLLVGARIAELGSDKELDARLLSRFDGYILRSDASNPDCRNDDVDAFESFLEGLWMIVIDNGNRDALAFQLFGGLLLLRSCVQTSVLYMLVVW
jgi:hypothetical protein